MITICSESVTVHSNIIFEESLKKEFVEKRRIYLEKNTKLTVLPNNYRLPLFNYLSLVKYLKGQSTILCLTIF